MGRSVSVPNGAVMAAFQNLSDTYDLDTFDDWDWDFVTDELTDQFLEMSPSAYRNQEWAGREDRVLAENGLVQFGCSTYCGLMSIWLIPRYDDQDNLVTGWVNRIRPRFEAAFSSLRRIGTFSNGEGIYERVAA